MIVPYAVRLACLCLTSFFLIHFALALLARTLTPWVLRRVERIAARTAATLLFTLRLFPVALALTIVAGLCLPSFLSFERERGAEAAGIPFLAVAALGASVWVFSLWRGLRALIRSQRSAPRHSAILAGEAEPVWLWEGATPFVGLAGALRPRVVISRHVTQALEPEQLAAALRHERAHRASGDNFKRLLFLLAPEPLPCVFLFRELDRAWARFAEWAADDWAVAQDAGCSLPLAEALVRVARLGVTGHASPLFSPFVPAGEDIALRVNRLLNGPAPQAAQGHFAVRFLAIATVAAPFAALCAAPQSLSGIHQFLERLMQVG
jgi:hypothetical protein